MFMGPFDEGGDWNDKGIKGIYRFLNKSYNLILKETSEIEDTTPFPIFTERSQELEGARCISASLVCSA